MITVLSCFGNPADQDPEFPLPNENFRFGIIPAGSTDAIVMWYFSKFLLLPETLFNVLTLLFSSSYFSSPLWMHVKGILSLYNFNIVLQFIKWTGIFLELSIHDFKPLLHGYGIKAIFWSLGAGGAIWLLVLHLVGVHCINSFQMQHQKSQTWNA